jgi:8-oxo-dGTP pyrophosphatase MutT (NUDIX family)
VRTSSKLLVVDPDGAVLLLDCTDPGAPGTRWQELPGGGIEPGEDAVQAGVREVLEETGVVVPPEAVGPLLWTQVASFTWRRARHVALHEARVARLPGPPVLAPVAFTEAEQGTILGQRWWTPDEVAAHPGRFFPRRLPALLPRLLAGERVDEPDDDWDVPDGPPAPSSSGGGPPRPGAV